MTSPAHREGSGGGQALWRPLAAAILAAILGALSDGLCAESAAGPPAAVSAVLGFPAVDESLRLEAQGAIRRGGRYLCSRQLPDGSWAENPAVTSLCALALLNAPPEAPADFREHAARGVQFIVTRLAGDARSEFAAGQQYPVFTVAVAMLAVIRIQEAADAAFLRQARQFLLNAQCRNLPETDPLYGGFRSGKDRRPDLTTTEYALEALYLSDALDRPPTTAEPAAGKRADAAYAAALVFISRCQRSGGLTAAPPGGFFRDSPGDGIVATPLPGTPRSIGYLTCAGLKSLLYAGVKADDPRVRAALGWLREAFSVDHNPGLGEAGYYTYLFTLTKALNAWERDAGGLAAAFRPTWRREVTEALLARQGGDGQWTHRAPDWWENRPELTTAYALLALELTLRE